LDVRLVHELVACLLGPRLQRYDLMDEATGVACEPCPDVTGDRILVLHVSRNAQTGRERLRGFDDGLLATFSIVGLRESDEARHVGECPWLGEPPRRGGQRFRAAGNRDIGLTARNTPRRRY